MDAPRFCISAGLPDAEVKDSEAEKAGDVNAEVFLEEGIPHSIISKLKGAELCSGYDSLRLNVTQSHGS